MSSKKEEEKNEKIIRGLLKLPPNRRCINCDSLGPQYVCTNFWTFICMTCSGIHREFTHRVKSVSMSKFSSQEVDALQNGGNQRAREIFLENWEMQHRRLPISSNAEKIREFIKTVYVDKKYAGGASSNKPPRETLNNRNSEEESRKASSYHSYSQSPPYDHQYEDRLYGKQTRILNRRHCSDRIHYDEKFSSIICSPGRRVEQMYEDRFANEGSAPRFSDFSISNAGDTFRYDGQSPSFEKDTGYSSPSVQSTRDVSVGDANTKNDLNRIPRPYRVASSGSFGSFDSNSASLKSAGSSTILDISLDSEQHIENSQPEARVHHALPSSSAYVPAVYQDPFGLQSVQSLPGSSVQCIDLFAENAPPLSLATSSDKNPASISSENEGWATFDMPKGVETTSEAKNLVAAISGNEMTPESFDVLFSANNNSLWPPMQMSSAIDSSMSMTNQWNLTLHDSAPSSVSSIPQPWNAFNDFSENSASTSFFDPPKVEPQTSNHAVTAVIEPSSESKLITTNLQGSSSHGEAGVLYMPSEDALNGTSVSLPSFPLMEGSSLERKTTNPFDLPDGPDFETPSAFLDMNFLQAALPNPQIPPTFLSSVDQSWFPENPMSTYMPSGGLAGVADQQPGSQLQNSSSQGPPSRGGNPFA